MSVNFSGSSDSHLQPNRSSNIPFDLECLMSEPGSIIFITFTITNMFLLLPLCIFIFYYGLQQWCKKRSTSSVATIRHSDSFTYHLVAIELAGILGNIVCCCGIYKKKLFMLEMGDSLYAFTWYGQNYFHTLICVERYLAVVHPITYVSLKTEKAVRIRNIIFGCIWLLCFGGMAWELVDNSFVIFEVIHLILMLVVVFFCNRCVLRALTHSGPGDNVRDKEKVDQSKQRAFYTILVIFNLLVLRFSWGLVWTTQYISNENGNCVTMGSEIWFNMPSSLVLPLLFLHRTGIFACCMKCSHWEQGCIWINKISQHLLLSFCSLAATIQACAWKHIVIHKYGYSILLCSDMIAESSYINVKLNFEMKICWFKCTVNASDI